MIGLNKNRKSFFINAMHLFLAIKGKINFLQLERFGDSDEQTYCNHFEKSFHYYKFNLELLKELAVGITLSYLTSISNPSPPNTAQNTTVDYIKINLKSI
jgi:hypothetical protein